MKTKINLRNVFEAVIIILIIVDLVLLMLITFTTVSPFLSTKIICFDLMVCIILFFDFIYRMRQAKDKKAFIKHNWPDIIAMIPFDILPIPQKYVFIARLFRLVRLVTLFRREWKYISSFFKQTHINFAIGMLLFTVFAGTIIFYLLEHGTNPAVHTIWDSMWFTITTMITGNSDINPRTNYGEVVSVLMMVIGIAFVGILTASLASWLIKSSNKTEDDLEKKRIINIENSVDEIKNEIVELKELLKNKQ